MYSQNLTFCFNKKCTMYATKKHIIYLFFGYFCSNLCPKTIQPGDILNVWLEISHVSVLFSDFLWQKKIWEFFWKFLKSVNSINFAIFGKICQTFNVTKLNFKKNSRVLHDILPNIFLPPLFVGCFKSRMLLEWNV